MSQKQWAFIWGALAGVILWYLYRRYMSQKG